MTETLTDTPARNYVAGEWRDAGSGETYEKRDPWRPSSVTGIFQASSAEDANDAVAAAAAAFPAWASLPAPARAAFFHRAADAIDGRTEQIARDMTAEMGKPLREARMETARAATILRFAAGEAWRPVGEVYAASVPLQRLYTVRRPLGVVALITPWNFPIAIPVWKLAPALIHGNTVVLKLAHDAPRTGLHVAECFAEAGLPAGVLNVLTGSGSKVGAALVESPDVRAISFTGSVAVGHGVRAAATARGCRVQLELGGQNPFVVMADAELDRAVEAAYAGAFWSAGQKCTATRRILVQETVYDAFRERLLARVAAGKVGDPSDPETEVGPLVTEARARRRRRRDRARARPGRHGARRGRERRGRGLPRPADRLRGRRRGRVPLLRGGLRAGHLALPRSPPSTRHSSGRTPSSSGCRRRSSRVTSTPSSASRRSSRRGSSTSTRRRPAPTSTCRSAGSRGRASARTSRDGRRSSSTPTPSPCTRMRLLPEARAAVA